MVQFLGVQQKKPSFYHKTEKDQAGVGFFELILLLSCPSVCYLSLFFKHSELTERERKNMGRRDQEPISLSMDN